MIYSPEEDSYLLKEQVDKFVKENSPKKILDVGSGSGFQIKNLNGDLTLVDINSEAIKHLKKKFPKAKVIHSDLFSKISKKEKFNLIIFNPPYLPEDKLEDKESKLATTGGKLGSEVINKFLKQVKNYLTSEGKILLLTSSLTKEINWQGFKKKKLASKKLFFEELYVWELN